jgi:hypothetical protein
MPPPLLFAPRLKAKNDGVLIVVVRSLLKTSLRREAKLLMVGHSEGV